MSPRRRGGTGLGRAGSRCPEHRVGNRTFYVVAEGEGTEHDYFGRLNTAYGADLKFLIKTPPSATQRDGLPPSRVVDEARYGLAEPGIDEVWGLFDHDGRPDIDQVCSRANRERVNVALSHPSFDLWLLLHFQDFPPAAQHGKNRLIIEKLRTAHPAFADYGKRTKRMAAAELAAKQCHAHFTLALATADPRHAGRAVPLLREAVDGFGPTYARSHALNLPGLAGALVLTTSPTNPATTSAVRGAASLECLTHGGREIVRKYATQIDRVGVGAAQLESVNSKYIKKCEPVRMKGGGSSIPHPKGFVPTG